MRDQKTPDRKAEIRSAQQRLNWEAAPYLLQTARAESAREEARAASTIQNRKPDANGSPRRLRQFKLNGMIGFLLDDDRAFAQAAILNHLIDPSRARSQALGVLSMASEGRMPRR